MNKKAKILLLNASNKYGGVSAVMLNYYINIDHSLFSFDFLSPNKSTFKSFEKIIHENNDEIYELNVEDTGIKRTIKVALEFNKFLKNNKYDIIHINSGLLFYNTVMAKVAKKNNVKNVIVHSHSTIVYKGIKSFCACILKKILENNCDHFYACSKFAAKSMFTRKSYKDGRYCIINNAIDTNKFKYSEEERLKIRSELGLAADDILIGNVARFSKEKNHIFMLKLQKKICNLNKKAKICFIGTGVLEKEIKELAKKMKIDKNILFLGMKNDVNRYYNAMDYFILPSLYEGLPVVGIEAQCNGLKCFFSNNITREVDITKNNVFLDINEENLDLWANVLLDNYYNFDRKNFPEIIKENFFDIKEESKKLACKYKKMLD